MKQSVVIKIGAFAPNIIIYTGNMGRLNKVKKKESKNVKEDLLQEKRQRTGNYSLSCRKKQVWI